MTLLKNGRVKVQEFTDYRPDGFYHKLRNAEILVSDHRHWCVTQVNYIEPGSHMQKWAYAVLSQPKSDSGLDHYYMKTPELWAEVEKTKQWQEIRKRK